MNQTHRVSCWICDRFVSLQSYELQTRYGDEMRLVLQEQLSDAAKNGPMAVTKAWWSIVRDTIFVVGPIYIHAFRVITLATLTASALVVGFALSFCSLGSNAEIVHACSQAEALPAAVAKSAPAGELFPVSQGHKMFLECTGEIRGGPTVILATGRGIGSYRGWSLVQSKVELFARVCSYDPLGVGESDRIPGAHPVSEVVENMHDLFDAARLARPLILVGASAGGVLIRHYEEQYPSDVAGFIFVDSAHEEQEWRDAAISTTFDPNWDNLQSLKQDGMLPPQQHLAWHDDVPMIILERTDLPPCGAFPGLTQTQCDQINQAWHSFQVDLSHRSKYAQLRPVAGSGHLMPQQKPQAIAQAISDVINEVKSKQQ